MRFPIFKAARFYHYSGDVWLKETTGKAAYFDVDDEDVVVEKTGEGYVKISCTCKHCSIKGLKYQTWCARKLAVMSYLMSKEGKVGKG